MWSEGWPFSPLPPESNTSSRLSCNARSRSSPHPYPWRWRRRLGMGREKGGQRERSQERSEKD